MSLKCSNTIQQLCQQKLKVSNTFYVRKVKWKGNNSTFYKCGTKRVAIKDTVLLFKLAGNKLIYSVN